MSTPHAEGEPPKGRMSQTLSTATEAAGALVMAFGRGAVARLAVREAGLAAQDRLVDIGCGPGTAVREAARHTAAATGVDPNAASLALARRFTRPGTAGDITWLRGQAEALPLPDGCATIVWSLSSVHHWQDPAAGFAEARRVLAPGGRLLIAERLLAPGARGPAAHGFTREQARAVADELAAAGFADGHVRTSRARRRVMTIITASRG